METEIYLNLLVKKIYIGGAFEDFKDPSGSVVASIESDKFIGTDAMNNIRHKHCEIVVDNVMQRCSVCTEY